MKLKLSVVFIITVILLTSCDVSGGKTAKPVETEDLQMGTVITQRVYGSGAGKVAELVSARLKEINDSMTVNAAGGEVNELNAAAGQKKVVLSPDTFFVLNTALQYAKYSRGAFDVTVGPLVKAWGIFTDHPRIPSAVEIEKLKKLINYKNVLLDPANRTAMLEEPEQSVDLGGIAKGYAGDEAVRIYKENGIKSAYVNLGGNVVVLGNKPDGSLWKIGIQNPRDANGEYIGILETKNKAIVTSGDYERYFEKNGIRYHHILDPKTGYPSDSGLISTTIVTDSSIIADALSTSAFILGLEEGMKLVASLKNVEAIFITKDRKVYITPGLKNIFQFTGGDKGFQYVEKR